MQAELSRLSLPTLKKLHALAVPRGSVPQAHLGRSGLAKELVLAMEASTAMNHEAQEEEDGWLLLNRSHGPTPLHSPPQSPSLRTSSLPPILSNLALSSDWSPPSWATESRSKVANSASSSSNVVDRLNEWNPPSWAPKPSPSAQKKAKVAMDSRMDLVMEMGERKGDWEWEAPAWSKVGQVDAKADFATKDHFFPPSFGISDVLPQPPPHHDTTPSSLVREWSPPSWAPPSAQIEPPPPPPVPSATVAPEVSEWTAPTWLRRASIGGREREWDFSPAGLAV